MGIAGEAKHDRLDGLNITNFKSRMAERKSFSFRFVAGQGFRPADEVTKAEVKDKLSVLEGLLTDEPINGTVFKEKAKSENISREAAERFLKDWQHQGHGLKPNEKVYWRPRAAA